LDEVVDKTTHQRQSRHFQLNKTTTDLEPCGGQTAVGSWYLLRTSSPPPAGHHHHWKRDESPQTGPHVQVEITIVNPIGVPDLVISRDLSIGRKVPVRSLRMNLPGRYDLVCTAEVMSADRSTVSA
jgi:hypothetical protein